MRKRFYIPSLIAIATGATFGLIDRADAHVPEVTADCRVLEVTLTDYEPESVVTITVDGQSSTTSFSGNFHRSIKTDEWDLLRTGTSTPCVPTTTAKTCSDNFQSGLPRCTAIIPPPTTVPVLNPPTVEHLNPATPPCVLDGRYDANSPECIDTGVATKTVTPPVQPEVLAFTGSHSTNRAVMGFALFGVGLLTLLAGRRFGKVI